MGKRLGPGVVHERGPGSGPSKYAELPQFAIAKGFSLSTSQETKTAIVLESIEHPVAR
jgi:hypothetical protein